MAQDCVQERRAATSETRVSLSDYHHNHRLTTMTTTSDDNNNGDQDDIMREDDFTPHQSHPGIETPENPNEFHKYA